eukprot:scaffold4116_cov338-Prasinococcus_capsulatus_cf.AAC.10
MGQGYGPLRCRQRAKALSQHWRTSSSMAGIVSASGLARNSNSPKHGLMCQLSSLTSCHEHRSRRTVVSDRAMRHRGASAGSGYAARTPGVVN